MTNHPNRSKAMKWTRDGDQWVSQGTIGTYTISEWIVAGGDKNFAIAVNRKSGGRKGIGEFSSLGNAKLAVETYDGYRSRPMEG